MDCLLHDSMAIIFLAEVQCTYVPFRPCFFNIKAIDLCFCTPHLGLDGQRGSFLERPVFEIDNAILAKILAKSSVWCLTNKSVVFVSCKIFISRRISFHSVA